jgi:hypothetical protein
LRTDFRVAFSAESAAGVSAATATAELGLMIGAPGHDPAMRESQACARVTKVPPTQMTTRLAATPMR